MEEKNEKGKNIVIAILIGVIVCLAIALIFVSYNKFIVKDNNNTNINNNNSENSSQKQTQTKSIFDGVNVTKESLEEFLSLMVGYEELPYNNIEEVANPNLSNDDHATFVRIVRMLFYKKQYEKNGDVYYFNVSDVNKLAKMYFDKNNFNYDANGELAFKLNGNKYESTLAFGLFDEVYSYDKPIVNDFKIENDLIVANCSIKEFYPYGKNETKKYIIKLSYEDNSYIIKSIENSN